jgi:NAD(P)-dependent dehydrogenase (short-subunit alcohol dehydrogenase family)
MEQRPGRLAGKVALVTGAGSSGPGVGTGKATSILFAREGAKVLLIDRVADHAEETLATICDEGGEASIYEADITQAVECQAMVEAAVERYGGLHILMNNVGIAALGTVVDVTEEDWDRVLEVNLKGMMLTSKYAIPKMIASGGGSIINVSSIEALRSGTVAAIVPYTVSKGGILALTTAMAVQHGRENIRVNAIAPGFLYTPMVAPLLTEETRELRRRAAPLGTEGTAWDVAWAAVFLASEEARWITGVVLPVDAGLLATTPLSTLPYLRQV